jgi:aspartate racemase
MEVIGLIGGMNWNSTLEYYRLINEMIAARLGSLHSASVI